MTRRVSIKLLGEILLDRPFFAIMNKFISSEENIKIVMNLLLDKHKNIQLEAFNVFKLFAANPRKSAPVKEILQMNKQKLIEYISEFHNDKRTCVVKKLKILRECNNTLFFFNNLIEEEQFVEEKNLVLSEIKKL